MTGLEQAIQMAMRQQADSRQIKQTLIGTATNVGETSCDVLRDDAPTLYSVRLNAVDDSLDSFVTVYPAPDSIVLVGIIENIRTEAVVLRCSQVEKVRLKIGKTEMLIDGDGCKTERNGENLNNVLSDFIDEVAKIIVIQGTTPNVPALQQIKQRLNKILT